MLAQIFVVLIRVYQWTLSPLLGPCCRFQPTCSNYAITCLQRFGVLRGSWLAVKRIARCHPFSRAGFDPPPPAHAPSEHRHGAL